MAVYHMFAKGLWVWQKDTNVMCLYVHEVPSAVLQVRRQEKMFYLKGSEALGQAAQRSFGCPIPGGIEGQVGWGPGQTDLVSGNPAHGRGYWI